MQKIKKEKKEKLGFKKTLSNNFFAILSIWKSSPSYLIVYFAVSLIGGILDFLSEGYLLRRTVNSIESGNNINDVLLYIGVLGIIISVYGILNNWFWDVMSPPKQRKIASYIEKMLFKKSAEVELSCYENPDFYDKYVRAMDEAYHRMMSVMRSLNMLIYKIIALFANSMLLFVIDPYLIIFSLIPLAFGYFKRLKNVAFHDYKLAEKTVNRRNDYIKRTFYLGEYAKEMRIGGMYKNMLNDLNLTFKEYIRLIKKYGWKITLFEALQQFGLEVFTILGATLYSVWKAMVIGDMNTGDCIVVLSSIGTISYCLNNLIQNLAEFGEHALFLEDVRYFLNYEPKIKNGASLLPKEVGDLEVKNLYFRYEGSESDTLKNINFTLHKGERIALVGSNGSGKTTLVKLLLRLYDTNSGEIKLSGKNIKELNIKDYRKCFSTVFQDFKMFSLSVKDNVLLRPKQHGDRELVTKSLQESGIYEKIQTLNNGIDTILTREFDDNGANLSVGQQQKLSLARIFADKTPFVILDEPSSALDPIAEYKMFENMMRATEGRSVIFISHRLSSAVLADKVILLDNGEIAEYGTHTELLKNNGKYAEMFHRQAENYLGNEVTINEQK
jgi:ATP-binding cassette subfamily B protein